MARKNLTRIPKKFKPTPPRNETHGHKRQPVTQTSASGHAVVITAGGFDNLKQIHATVNAALIKIQTLMQLTIVIHQAVVGHGDSTEWPPAFDAYTEYHNSVGASLEILFNGILQLDHAFDNLGVNAPHDLEEYLREKDFLISAPAKPQPPDTTVNSPQGGTR